MDFVLLAFSVFYFLKGIFKGFISQVFSLIGTFAIAILAWKLTELPFFENILGNIFINPIENVLNGLLPGQFENLLQLETALSQSKLGILFNVLFSKLLTSITFDGKMTAGQLLAPSLNSLATKLLTFVILFFGMALILKILRIFLNKMINLCGFSVGNRILGGLIGLVKGFLIFGIVYLILMTLASFLLNETLLEFVKSGPVSNFIYENFIIKAINLFY